MSVNVIKRRGFVSSATRRDIVVSSARSKGKFGVGAPSKQK
jgi:hypothetical protein